MKSCLVTTRHGNDYDGGVFKMRCRCTLTLALLLIVSVNMIILRISEHDFQECVTFVTLRCVDMFRFSLNCTSRFLETDKQGGCREYVC